LKDQSKAMQLLQIFEQSAKPGQNRIPLHFSYLCLLQQEQDGSYSIALELAAGTKKHHIITQPYRFLDAVLHHKTYAMSRGFRYEPELYSIDSNALTICQLLWQQLQLFSEYEAVKMKLIPVQGSLWHRLEPILEQEPRVQLQYYLDSLPLDEQLQVFDQLQFSSDKLPITLSIMHTDSYYRINGEQLQSLVLLPNYELACWKGMLYRISWEQGKQLLQLANLLQEEAGQLLLEQDALSQFIDQAVPQLQRIITIHIADDIAGKLTSTPLQAAIYLDRIRERLLIGVEFHYGSLSIQPFQPAGTATHHDFIVLRERDKEDAILNLLLELPGLQTEGGMIIEGDDDEYTFFRTILPQLKQLAQIHATTAVKLRYVTEQVYPQLKLSWEEKSNWLQYSFSMKGISDQELKQLLAALVQKRKYYRLSQGTLLSLENPQYDALLRMMKELGLTHPNKYDERIPLQRAIPAMLAMDQAEGIMLSRSLRQFLNSIRNPEQLNAPLPQMITAQPRDYQLDGYQWMTNLAQHQLGGILADEMGLGKTLQAIMFLVSQYEMGSAAMDRQLVVTPASLLYNWEHELQRFAPGVEVAVLEAEQFSHLKHKEAWQQAHIWIVSYQTLRSQLNFFEGHHFHTIICDEAQAFKNDYTKTSLALRKLSAAHRFALTGTPIENRLEELLSILSFVNPELFTEKQKWLDLHRAKLKQAIAPFLLRRTKKDVLQELPPKVESTYSSPLTMEQKKLYLAHLAKLQEDSLKHLDPKRKGERRIRILAGITRLRQICCHPALFIEGYTGDSAKLQQLLQIVEEGSSMGKRILIFSQFTSMLRIISTELELRGFRHFYLDGSTPAKERIEFVDRFNQGERELFLLSLKAGGTGLNLVGADTVILYDLWWNPAVEQQAGDRVHRIGQQQPVHIIRLVAEGTLEDKMIQLQERKQQLVNDMLEQDTLSSSSLSEDDLLLLLQHQSLEDDS